MTVMTRKTGLLVPAQSSNVQQRYLALLQGENGAQWLAGQLQRAAQLPDDLPDDPQQLAQWSAHAAARVARDYTTYLQQRRQGEPRRYFANRAQAL